MEKQLTGQGTPVSQTQGHCLRKEREERDWSQAEVARRVGVSTKTVKRWEGNTVAPHPYASRKLCTVFEKSKEELMLGKLTSESERTRAQCDVYPIASGGASLGSPTSERTRAQCDVYPSARSRRVGLLVLVLLIFTVSIASVLRIGALLLHAPSQPSTLRANVWHQIRREAAPTCQKERGVVWYVHIRGTSISCQRSGLLMQQISHFYAEVDLVQVNDRTYSQSTFRTHVQVTFPNPGDGMTFAALLVQTPTAVNAIGGYIFALNPAGGWQLQSVESATALAVVKEGNVPINPSQPSTLTVEVRNGMLHAAVNNQWVVASTDQLQPSPGAVGLMVERTGQSSSSPILFSNFELNQ